MMPVALASVVTYAYSEGYDFTPLTVTPFSLIGVVLSIFLGFRTNASYDRFWEGRKLWGRFVNCTRTLTRQIELFVRRTADHAAIREFRLEQAHLLIAYIYSVRDLLRRTDGNKAVKPPPSAAGYTDGRRNPPNGLIQLMSSRIGAAWEAGWVDDYNVGRLDQSLEELTSVQGACERILYTPVPFSYSFYVHRITMYYCLLLPFGIVDVVGLHTPLVTALIAAGFLGLDAIGSEIENPFGMEPNDLPLTALSRNIEIDILQMVGEEDVPKPLQPLNEILL